MSKSLNVIGYGFQSDRFSAVAKRFLELREAHHKASDCLWTGMVAAEFTDTDLALLSDYLSKHDVRLIQKVRQPIPAQPADDDICVVPLRENERG